MNAYKQTSVWIYRMFIVLGSIVAGSMVYIIVMVATSRPIPGTIAALGLVALAGLVRLLISPLNQEVF